MTCAGCGGGGDGSESAQASNPGTTAPPQRTVVVDYYGDSTIWGTVSGHPGQQYTKNPPVVLQAELTRRCGFPVTVNNFAVPGTYASQLLYGSSEYGGLPFAKRMADSHADLVIPGGYGMNDAAGYADAPSFRFHMSELVRIAKESGKKVVMETPNPPVPDGTYTLPQQPATVAQFVPILRDIATQQNVPIVDQYSPYLPPLISEFPDGIHPSEDVAYQKAMRVADVIASIICPAH